MQLVHVFCGIDWAEDHYDVALVDQAGVVLAERSSSVADLHAI
jgi:hypothetical protein